MNSFRLHIAPVYSEYHANAQIGSVRLLKHQVATGEAFRDPEIDVIFNTAIQVPHYAEDLGFLNEQNVYVTPAHPLRYTFAFHTFKMASVSYYSFTPQISSNQAVFGRAKELAPESLFEFFVLSEREVSLPRWIRLGKWMAKARVDVVASATAQVRQGSYQASGTLNPLDLPTFPENCNIVAMAPASLITNVYATGDHYDVNLERHTVSLPVGMRYQPVYAQR